MAPASEYASSVAAASAVAASGTSSSDPAGGASAAAPSAAGASSNGASSGSRCRSTQLLSVTAPASSAAPGNASDELVMAMSSAATCLPLSSGVSRGASTPSLGIRLMGGVAPVAGNPSSTGADPRVRGDDCGAVAVGTGAKLVSARGESEANRRVPVRAFGSIGAESAPCLATSRPRGARGSSPLGVRTATELGPMYVFTAVRNDGRELDARRSVGAVAGRLAARCGVGAGMLDAAAYAAACAAPRPRPVADAGVPAGWCACGTGTSRSARPAEVCSRCRAPPEV